MRLEGIGKGDLSSRSKPTQDLCRTVKGRFSGCPRHLGTGCRRRHLANQVSDGRIAPQGVTSS